MGFRYKLAGSATALALALGACSDDETTPIAIAESDHQQRLQAMPEGQRNAVFIRALRDAGRDCQGVERSAYQGVREGIPTWTVRCNDGGDWLVLISGAGVAQVVSAAEAVRGGLAAPEANAR